MRSTVALSFALIGAACLAQGPRQLMLADMEGDLSGYRGVQRDTQVVKAGDFSALWADHAANPSAVFDGIATDWTGFDNLGFWLHSEAANNAQFMLIIRSENPATDGMDYWSRKITLDWTGWRHFRIPIASLGAGARSPLGWDRVDTLYFTASGWDCTPQEDSAIRIDDIRLTNDPCRVSLDHAEGRRDATFLYGTHRIRVENALGGEVRVTPSVDAPEWLQVTVEPQALALPAGGVATVSATLRVPRDLASDSEALAAQQVTVSFPIEGEDETQAVGIRIPLRSLVFMSLPVPEHPRVLVSPEIVQKLRQRVGVEGESRDRAQRIIKSADSIIQRYAEGIPAAESASVERGRGLLGPAETLAMAYLLTEDARYAHEAARLITVARDWSTWVYEFHRGIVADLGTAAALRHLGIAYDWAYQGMTQAEREACRDTLSLGLNLWREGIQGDVWWNRSFRSNWCAVCCGGGALAAVALLGEYPHAAWVLSEAYPRIVSFLDEGGIDGGWPEGTGYWGYGVSHAALLAEALKVLTDGEMDLFEHPYLRATWQFPLYMHCPPNGTINFADCGYGAPNRLLTLQLGIQTGNPHAVWYYRQRPGNGTLDLLWDTGDLSKSDPADLPQSIHFTGIDWAALRSGWDGDATIFGLRGGNNGENHGMLECGNFIVNSMGERLIVDHGATTYTHEYFSGKRWDFYRANSHGSNVVLVDDMDQKPGRDAAGKITQFLTTPAFDYLQLDATAAYPDFVKLMQRRVVFIKPDLLVMLDTVKTDGERSFEWRCHPATQGEVSLGAERMLVDSGRASLVARWLLPEDATVTAGQAEGEDYHVSVKPVGKADEMRFLTVMRCGQGETGRALFEMDTEEALEQVTQAPRALLIMESEGDEWRIIRKLLRGQGFEVDWVDESRLADLPSDWHSLADYAAVFLVPTKAGAEGLSGDQQAALVEYVRNGGGLMMMGGTASFGAGRFSESALADILPVDIVREDDNITHITQRPYVTAADHPVLRDIPQEWPVFGSDYGGYHDVRLKEGATQILAVDRTATEADVPFIAAGAAGRGRVMTFGALWAFGTGGEFKTWEHASTFLGNVVQWLSKDTAQPDPERNLARAGLEDARFSLGENLTPLVQDAGVGFTALPPTGYSVNDTFVLLRTGEGDLSNERLDMKTDAVTAAGREGDMNVLALLGVSWLEIGSEGRVYETSVPTDLVIWGADDVLQGHVVCPADCDFRLRFQDGDQVMVDGEHHLVVEGGWLRLRLAEGRHTFELE